jgi:hypothetical protein
MAAIAVFLARVNGSSSFVVRHLTTKSTFAKSTVMKSSINADHSMTSRIQFDFPTFQSIQAELKNALDNAREVDKKHGLCTEPSKQAWSVVDSLYAKMQMFQGPDNNTVPSSSSTKNEEPINSDAKGRKYFF